MDNPGIGKEHTASAPKYQSLAEIHRVLQPHFISEHYSDSLLRLLSISTALIKLKFCKYPGAGSQ